MSPTRSTTRIRHNATRECCRLCHEERPLCNSHIIPEFFYAPLYHDKHQLLLLSTDSAKPVQHMQKGYREHLLCQPCETQLSRHENYVRRFLFGGAPLQIKNEGNRYVMSGLEYPHVRLCFLSILWRMSVASLPIFADVDLGPHEKRLRAMILKDDPGAPEQYGFIGIVPFMDGEFFPGFMLQPECINYEGRRIYRAVIGGILFMFLVASHAVDPGIRQAFVQPAGTWVWLGKDIRKIKFLMKWMSGMASRAAPTSPSPTAASPG